jgi:hypothetical protein
MFCVKYILTRPVPEKPQVAPVPPSPFNGETEDFKTWAKGWQDRVYQEESTNPEITLGELLLVYFEWMSVHKVRGNTYILHVPK